MKNIDPFTFYRIVAAGKLHFEKDEYDIFRTNGNIKIKGSTFDDRKDAQLYANLASKIDVKEILPICIANMVADNPKWMYNFSNEGLEIYTTWKSRIGSLTINFKNDLQVLSNFLEKEKYTYDVIFKSEHKSVPIILKYLYADKISIETIILVDMIEPFINRFEEEYLFMKKDPLWIKTLKKVKKYSPFFKDPWIRFDSSKIKMVWFDFKSDNSLIAK